MHQSLKLFRRLCPTSIHSRPRRLPASQICLQASMFTCTHTLHLCTHTNACTHTQITCHTSCMYMYTFVCVYVHPHTRISLCDCRMGACSTSCSQSSQSLALSSTPPWCSFSSSSWESEDNRHGHQESRMGGQWRGGVLQ